MSDLPSISIVIPSFRGAATIGATLRELLAQRYDGPREVLVVRTGPDDGTDDIVRGHPGVRLVSRAERAFAGAARNLGAARADGSIIAFLDADCTPLPGWLLSVATAAGLGSRAQGGAIETRPPKTLGSRAEEFLETLEFHPRGRPRTLGFASAANSAYDAELFRATEGFPDVKLGEDLLLGDRVRQIGVPISFNPEMRVLHDNAVRFGPFLSKQREHGRYSAWVRKQRPLAGSALARSPWLAPLVAPIRMLRLLTRTTRVAPSLLPSLIVLSPLIAVGVASFTWGFVEGASRHAE